MRFSPGKILAQHILERKKVTYKYLYSKKSTYDKKKIWRYIAAGSRIMPGPCIGPKLFWTIQIALDGYKLFWSGPNRFGQVQITLLWTNFYNFDLTKMIWTRPK